MSSKVISNQNQGNQNPQNNMIASFSFTSTGNCNSMVELFTSMGRDFDLTIKFNEKYSE